MVRFYALFGDRGLHAGKHVHAEDRAIHFSRFYFDDYVIRGGASPFEVDEERFRAVVSEIEDGRYDVVYADCREALLIRFALLRRGHVRPQFLVQDPDLLQTAEEARRFITLRYGQDPLPDFLRSKDVHWMVITRNWLPFYEKTGVPADRIYYVPMAASSLGFFFPAMERFLDRGCEDQDHPPGEFILSTGTHDRDYDTLVRAVEGLALRVRIVCSLKQHTPIPATNVTWSDSLPEPEYLEAFRRARYVVLPLRASSRAAGQMNCVIPMHLGKAVVASRSEHLDRHIVHRKTGYFFMAGDASSLRRVLVGIESDFERTRRVALEAKRRAGILSSAARSSLALMMNNIKEGVPSRSGTLDM